MATAAAFDRQSRLLGDAGQNLLARTTVGVIGAGGAGSLIVEYVARLGVRHIVCADPDRLETTNVPRIVGARSWDAWPVLTKLGRPAWLRRLGKRLAARKVTIAKRVARQANGEIMFEGIPSNVVLDHVAKRFADCDYIFLAADSMQARLVFNAIVNQYLIPGVQVGAKVRIDQGTGAVIDVYSVVRPVTPGHGCLWCNGLITPAGLQDEAASDQELDAQRYVDDPTITAPSVITLNAVAASHATNDFLFWLTGLTRADSTRDYIRFLPRDRDIHFDEPRRDVDCPECGSGSGGRLGMGDGIPLPTRK
jgi:molybdopterin/thiamine biosynthesis adenylyltransferase